jgi:tetratricopeptide (TPR) repeat protein
LPTIHRNLALVYYNRQQNPGKALRSMERAFALDRTDARVLFELDLLRKRAGVVPQKRLTFLRKHQSLVEQREDLLVEFVTLLNFFGLREQALQILLSRRFHPWEGGEGKVTGQYVTSLVEIAKKLLRVGKSETIEDPEARIGSAIELLERARVYPENLGEGKLHGAQENQILYWLGLAQAQAGDRNSAVKCWREASTGMETPTPAVYYNDQNPETIFYQGLALQQLGRTAAAAMRFSTLVRFGRKHLHDRIEIDYFAVSLPEFMVFDDDLNRRNHINCRYLIALGLAGLRKWNNAREAFREVLAFDPAHLGARLHLDMLPFLANSAKRANK